MVEKRSDDKNFRKLHLIATLDSTTQCHNYLYVKADKKYRYIRYRADSDHFAQMSEMWAYDTLTGEDKVKMHVVDASPVDTNELLTHSAEDMIALAYGNHKFIVVGNTGVIGISTDGINWTKSNTVSGIDVLYSIR